MKLKIIFIFIIAFKLFGQNNWTMEPEENIIRSLSKGKIKINKDTLNSWEFRVRYGEKAILKPFDFNLNLDSLKLYDLRMIKYELYARKGYLFSDVVIRNHFNLQKWYQPIYWIHDVDFSLNSKEEEFYQKIKKRESFLLNEHKNTNSFNLDLIVNKDQVILNNDDFKNKLKENGYAIVTKKNIELYESYEENNYAKFPSFVTTDFYLQLNHLNFTNILTTIEEDNFIPIIKDLTKSLYEYSKIDIQNQPNNQEALFVQFYFAIAYEILTNKQLKIDKKYEKEKKEYLRYVKNSQDKVFLKLFNSNIDFSLFIPRGNYERSKAMKRYFRTMMWLSKIPFLVDDPLSLKSSIYINNLMNRKDLQEKYLQISNSLIFLIGNPDNLSILDLSKTKLKELTEIEKELKQMNPKKIFSKGALADNNTKLYFFPQLYTPDSDILNHLINLTNDETRRAFPKALDVFASLGVKPAESILLNTYKEVEHWKGYLDSLTYCKETFKLYDFTSSSYGNWLLTLKVLFNKEDNYPLLMKKDAWDYKNLNTSLASYAELKHDAILYAEQPTAAECDGDDSPYQMPPDPTHIGYVEPNIHFWQACINLNDQTIEILEKNKIKNKNIINCTDNLTEIAQFFLDVSKKELNNEILSEDEFSRIRKIGGQFEDFKKSLMKPIEDKKKEDEVDGDFLPNEDEMAVVADIFTTNGSCLELGVGRADDIYCIVNIGGFDYITRGSVFSYYEFQQPIYNRLKDSQWRQILNEGSIPKREIWYERLLINNFKENFKLMNFNPSSFIEYIAPDENK